MNWEVELSCWFCTLERLTVLESISPIFHIFMNKWLGNFESFPKVFLRYDYIEAKSEMLALNP